MEIKNEQPAPQTVLSLEEVSMLIGQREINIFLLNREVVEKNKQIETLQRALKDSTER